MYVEENTQFQIKVLSKSGLDVDGTYLPPAIHPSIADEPKTDMKTAMLEAEMVMGGAVSDLLEKTGGFGDWGLVGRGVVILGVAESCEQGIVDGCEFLSTGNAAGRSSQPQGACRLQRSYSIAS